MWNDTFDRSATTKMCTVAYTSTTVYRNGPDDAFGIFDVRLFLDECNQVLALNVAHLNATGGHERLQLRRLMHLLVDAAFCALTRVKQERIIA